MVHRITIFSEYHDISMHQTILHITTPDPFLPCITAEKACKYEIDFNCISARLQ